MPSALAVTVLAQLHACDGEPNANRDAGRSGRQQPAEGQPGDAWRNGDLLAGPSQFQLRRGQSDREFLLKHRALLHRLHAEDAGAALRIEQLRHRRLANSVGVNLVEARTLPIEVIVVLEKSECDSRKIEIKIAARTSISIFNTTLCAKPPCERSAPRLPCAGNGRRSCYRRAYTYQPAFLYRRC
jgi:hypothetical protein